MKKIFLGIGVAMSSLAFTQNYFGTQFIGESASNNPSTLTRVGNNIVLSGFIGGSITTPFPLTLKGGNADGIVSKISPTDGAVQWIKQFAGGGDEVVVDTAIDAAGNYYVTGYMNSSGSNAMDADPGPAVYPLPVESTLLNRDIFLVKLDPNGDFLWAKAMCTPSGAAADDVAAVKLDSNGNIYLAGSYGYVDFDPGVGTQIEMATGNSDAFIVKLDNNGNFAWVKTLQGTSNKKITDIEIDANNNIYAVGRFQGTIDLDPDATNTDVKTTAGGFDTFVSKYTSDGSYVWGLAYGGSGADTPEKIVVNGTNLYVGGAFTGTVDMDPTSGVNNITTAEGQDAYMSTFTTNGAYVSTFAIPGTTTNGDVVKDILIDSNGNFYLVGLFQNITVGGNNYVATAGTGPNADAFFMKLNPSQVFSSIYLVQGNNTQTIPSIGQLTATKFLAVGGSKGIVDFDYTAANSPETTPFALTYTYITKFDFETTFLGTNESASNSNSSFGIYPNPAVNEINIKSDSRISAVAIFNMEGRLALKQEKKEITQINVSLLPKGVYMLQALTEKGNKIQKKFIKK